MVKAISTVTQVNRYYVHNDHLGTPQSVTNDSGHEVWRADYRPFGEPTINADVDGDANLLVMNVRFPGQYYDAESGNHYNYFRDYNPSIGRYVQSDPIGLDGGMNTYLYALANPLRFSDRQGLKPIPCPGNNPGATCTDGDEHVGPKCVTGFCAADIGGPEPIDTRTEKEIECGQCQIICGASVGSVAPGPIVPALTKGFKAFAKSVGEMSASGVVVGGICELLCSEECREDKQCK